MKVNQLNIELSMSARGKDQLFSCNDVTIMQGITWKDF